MNLRNRNKLYVYIFALSVHLSLSVRQVDGFYTQRQRYASRMLTITPKECHAPDYPNVTGICMISLECQQRSGTVIGACRHGHLFGACCHDALGASLQDQQDAKTSTTEATTTTTTTTTTTEPSSSASSSSQQENNEVIPLSIDSEAQLDSQTAIPSLIDTFSELSPTFLSDLALDEHTTGMYASLPTSDDENDHHHYQQQEQALLRQKIEEATSAANMISTEFRTTTDRNPRTSTSTEKFHGVEPTGGGEVFHDEPGGIGDLDLDFKDNMIKYVDEIVTMRNNEITGSSPPSRPEPEQVSPEVSTIPVEPVEVPVEEPVPIPERVKIQQEIETMPFSTYTIVTSTMPAQDGKGEVTWSSISTTGSGDKMLPTTTTPVPPSSEEIIGVTVAQSIATIPSSTESNEIKDTTDSSTSHQSSSTESGVHPTKFTFSKLKYSPRPFKARSTTEKVVWTRPATSTHVPPWNNDTPVELEEDDDEEEEEEEDEEDNHDIQNNLVSSTSTQATSVEETTVASSTESGGVSSSSTSYFADDNVEEHNYSGGTDQNTTPAEFQSSSPSYYTDLTSTNPYSSSSYYTDPSSAYPYSPSSYYNDPSTYPYFPSSYYSDPSSSSYPYSPSSYYTDPSSSYPTSPSSSSYYVPEETSPPTSATSTSTTTEPPPSSSSPTEFGFDWSSPTLLNLLKVTTENLGKLYFGNASRSDYNEISSTTENEIDTSPNSIDTTGTTGSSTFKSTPYGYGSSSLAYNTDANTSNNGAAVRTTGLFSTNPNPTASSSWDSSIDSFVDQVMEGIVHDLNKSDNKIDDMIFNQNKNTKLPSVTKKMVSTSSTTTPTVAEKSAGKSSKHSTSSKHTTSSKQSTSPKNSTLSTKEKSKHKSKSRLSTSTEKTPMSTSTKSSKVKKVKTKVPASVASSTNKRRTNKNKAKPVKKVTTSIKSANSTRKRLDYKKDCGVRPLIKRGRIVGGTPSQFGSWPWHALVKETVWWGIFSKIKCGGVLIGAQHVLTAAHCQPQQSGTLSVVLGITNSDDSDSRAVTKTVKRIIPHPQFNARTYENDIAILELDSPVDFQPHIVPICLPNDDDVLEGKTAFVTGMGLLKHDGERPLVLQEVDLPILNNTECQKMFVRSGNKKPIIDSFICAGYEQGRKDSCGGDSGGPLSVKRSNGQWVLAGTVSHGIKCALANQPGVYMRTSYFKPWVDRVLNVARSRFRGAPRCNAPPLICARQRHHQQQLRQHQARHDNGFVNTLFRIFRLARKMVEEERKNT